MPPRKRLAFTLIELLVVIAIIAVLVGLLLPAVQKVRAAAARMSCQNNLHQIGLAALNYESANAELPPSQSQFVDAPPTARSGAPYPGNVHSWAPYLLPFIEQEALARGYSFDYPYFSSPAVHAGTPDNQAVIRQAVPVFICPSSPRPGSELIQTRLRYGPLEISFPMALSDYAPCDGVDAGSDRLAFFGYPGGTPASGLRSAIRPSLSGTAVQKNGVTPTRPARITDVRDGASNTLMYAECAGRPQYHASGRAIGEFRVSGAGWADHESAYNLDGAELGGEAADPPAVAAPGPCVINCHNNSETYAFHDGGANHCLADGAVRFVRESIGPREYAALVTAAGGGLSPAEAAPSLAD